jgi:hypothetical protein
MGPSIFLKVVFRGGRRIIVNKELSFLPKLLDLVRVDAAGFR